MRQIVHGTTWPPALRAAHGNDPSPADPTAAWRSFTGKPELRDDLWPRQAGRCAYCERCIAQTSSPIEHIRPKSRQRFPGLTFCYENLVLSCDTKGTCTDHKGDDWDDTFIPPTDGRCETWFVCSLNGKVDPAHGLAARDHEAVETTIRLVNLNHPHLKTERERVLTEIERACADLMDQPEVVLEFLRGEVDEHDSRKPFFSAKRRYFGNPS